MKRFNSLTKKWYFLVATLLVLGLFALKQQMTKLGPPLVSAPHPIPPADLDVHASVRQENPPSLPVPVPKPPNLSDVSPTFEFKVLKKQIKLNKIKLFSERANWKPVLLSNLFGDGWFVISFWATWCEPCIKELSKIEDFKSQHKELKIIGVLLEFNNSVVYEALAEIKKKRPISIDQYIVDQNGTLISEIFGKDKVPLPAFAIVSARGVVYATMLGTITDEVRRSKLVSLAHEALSGEDREKQFH